MSSTVKTAVSIQKSLFDQAESLAHKLNISRSRLFGLAIETYIQKHQNQILLDEINQAYVDEPDPEEKTRLAKMRRHQRKMVENQW